MPGFDRKVTLEEWLTEADRAAEFGTLSAITVQHTILTESGHMHPGDDVCGRQYAQGKAWSPKEEAALILGKCQVYSQELRGTQTFKLSAYYNQPQPSAFYYITTTGRTFSHGESEEPTARGQMAQGMAMAQLVVSRSFQKDDRLWQISQYLLEKLEGERNYWHEQARDAEDIIRAEMRQKALDMSAQRMREMEYERNTAMYRQLVTFLPAMLRHLTGDRNIVPEGLADSSILESVARAVRSMPEEQRLDVMGSLAGKLGAVEGGSQLAMVLGSRIQEIGGRLDKEDEAVRLLASVRSAEQKAKDTELARELLGMKTGGDGTPPKLTEGEKK